MCSQAELEGATSATYTSSAYYKEHGNLVDRELRHIYLDLEREYRSPSQWAKPTE